MRLKRILSGIIGLPIVSLILILGKGLYIESQEYALIWDILEAQAIILLIAEISKLGNGIILMILLVMNAIQVKYMEVAHIYYYMNKFNMK